MDSGECGKDLNPEKFSLDKARKRWKVLAKALLERQVNPSVSDVSCRRFTTFGLLQRREDSVEPLTRHIWFEYTCPTLQLPIKAKVRHLSGSVSTGDLIGFNNTGNLCVWPSEEVLSYYCLKHAISFNGRTVCEVGGGMTCLAGLLVAMASEANEVLLTDGNMLSVNNIKLSMDANKHNFGGTKVSCRVLRWDLPQDSQDLYECFDVVLCADCLFFNEHRADLLDTLMRIVKPMGEVIVLAPMRSNTLLEFYQLASKHCYVERLDNYDQHVWNLHSKIAQENETYNEDIHYPRMLVLRKFSAPMSS